MTNKTPEKLIVDCSTGDQSVVPLTSEEIAEFEAASIQAEKDRLAAEAKAAQKASAREALLKKLGITEEEATLLLS